MYGLKAEKDKNFLSAGGFAPWTGAEIALSGVRV